MFSFQRVLLPGMVIVETADTFQAEKAYCCQILLGQLLGLEHRLVFTTVQHYRLRLPNGAMLTVEDHFFSRFEAAADYLDAAHIPNEAPTVPHPFDPAERLTTIYGNSSFHFDNQHITCSIDVFASTFFMLSRWEEYVRSERDAHGRFPAKYALAYRSNFLDRPVVQEYAQLLGQLFRRLGWSPPPPSRQFRLQLSHDVDYPRLWWLPADRLRTLAGSIFARKQPAEAIFWLKNYFFQRTDPYDIFDELMDIAEQHGQPAHFNFLGKRPRTSDAWYSLEQPFVQNLCKKIAARGHVIGFHPSYESFKDADLFHTELESVRCLSGQAVQTGRQHFLRFQAPHTWRIWAAAGMNWDSSVGYSEREGFRAGICETYPVFDFLARQTLPVWEKPLIAMDVTLALYRQFSPETASDRLNQLRREVRKYNGEFTLLWHNSSWNTYFWAAWPAVYRSFVLGTC